MSLVQLHGTRPPSFETARNRRQKARASGLDPNHWYAVAESGTLGRNQVREVVFWKRSVAVFRDKRGQLSAIENRCAHRQLKLSLGKVDDECNLVCAYHGWAYNGEGKVAKVGHDLFGKKMPKLKVQSYPVTERYGLIWVFFGEKALADVVGLPKIPQLDGGQAWSALTIAGRWKSHHSMIMENICDFSHGYLHRDYRPFDNAKLTGVTPGEDSLRISYDTDVAVGHLSQFFVDRKRHDTTKMDLGIDYPYQWSSTGGGIRHFCCLLPVDERTTHAFFIFYFEHFRIPGLTARMPRWLMGPVLRGAKKFYVAPLLAQDGFAVEAEQEAYDQHFDAPSAELNPVVHAIQTLTVRKWESYLASQVGSRETKSATN